MQRYLYSLATDKSRGLMAGIFRIFLFILSLIYRLIVRILSSFYRIRPYRLNCKVISVGNITLGGTGKTSLVEMIAGLLKQKGHKVAVLSRGYKKPDARCSGIDASYKTMGDEPYMLSRNLSDIAVIVNKDRIRAAKQAIADYGVGTVILDDGFQQWRINKDLEMVTLDTTNPLGNLHLLPRGILREPLSSLRRADVFVLTKVNLKSGNQNIKEILKKINPTALIVEAQHSPVGFYKLSTSRDNLLNPDEFRGRQVSLVSGIADPQSFEKLISNLGIDIVLTFRFPDHYPYTEKDLDRIIKNSKQKDVNIIITTEKDSVRFSTLSSKLFPKEASQSRGSSGSRSNAKGVTTFGTTINFFVLRIQLKVLEYELFTNRIYSLY